MNKIIVVFLLASLASFAQVKINNVVRSSINVTPNFNVTVKDTKGGNKMRMLFNSNYNFVDSNRTNTFTFNTFGSYYLTTYEASGSIFISPFSIVGTKTVIPTITLCTIDSAKLFCNQPTADSIDWYVDSVLVSTLFKSETLTIYDNGVVKAVAKDAYNMFPISNQRVVTCVTH